MTNSQNELKKTSDESLKLDSNEISSVIARRKQAIGPWIGDLCAGPYVDGALIISEKYYIFSRGMYWVFDPKISKTFFKLESGPGSIDRWKRNGRWTTDFLCLIRRLLYFWIKDGGHGVWTMSAKQSECPGVWSLIKLHLIIESVSGRLLDMRAVWELSFR